MPFEVVKGGINLDTVHALSEEQHALLVGFVVECNSSKKKVNRKHVQDFLNVTVSLSTITNILRDAGVSFKVAHKDASEGHLQWSDIAHAFLKQLKRGDQIDGDGEFYKLDVTYDSHRNDDMRSVALLHHVWRPSRMRSSLCLALMSRKCRQL